MATSGSARGIGAERARLLLAHTPTPIEDGARLLQTLIDHLGSALPKGAADGTKLFIKRDDATGGAEAGNKIRKLEFLLAEAQQQGADVVISCGGLQSNHARATAVLAARLGMKSVLMLRTTGSLDAGAEPNVGNLLIDELVGAEVRRISVADYRRRHEVMAQVAAELSGRGHTPYVIVEGGSNALGSLGYVLAMGEVALQLQTGSAGGEPFDDLVVACGSGGTAAGLALGAGAFHIAKRVLAMAVCDDRAYFEPLIARLIREMQDLEPSLGEPCAIEIRDRDKGPAYGVSSPEQLQLLRAVARGCGLLLDPVYTGKAMAGLASALAAGELAGRRVLFVHTGGLPGLLASVGQL